MGQYDRVKEVLQRTERPLPLHSIHDEIRHHFGVLDSEAAISARIRDIRHDLEKSGEGTVYSERVPEKAYHRYRVIASPGGQVQSALFPS